MWVLLLELCRTRMGPPNLPASDYLHLFSIFLAVFIPKIIWILLGHLHEKSQKLSLKRPTCPRAKALVVDGAFLQHVPLEAGQVTWTLLRAGMASPPWRVDGFLVSESWPFVSRESHGDSKGWSQVAQNFTHRPSQRARATHVPHVVAVGVVPLLPASNAWEMHLWSAPEIVNCNGEATSTLRPSDVATSKWPVYRCFSMRGHAS